VAPPGLTQAAGIVTQNEEQALIASIDAVKLPPFRFHGWLGKRLTVSFGREHDFDTARFAPAEPIPNWPCPLQKRAARFTRLEPNDLVQVLLIRYDPGAGIGWHRNRPYSNTSSAFSPTTRSVLTHALIVETERFSKLTNASAAARSQPCTARRSCGATSAANAWWNARTGSMVAPSSSTFTGIIRR
jgi:hypothetical protein